MKFFWGFVVGAIIMAIVTCLMEGAADEAEIRENKIIAHYERQLSKCNTGNYCTVDNYRFLTISQGK